MIWICAKCIKSDTNNAYILCIFILQNIRICAIIIVGESIMKIWNSKYRQTFNRYAPVIKHVMEYAESLEQIAAIRNTHTRYICQIRKMDVGSYNFEVNKDYIRIKCTPYSDSFPFYRIPYKGIYVYVYVGTYYMYRNDMFLVRICIPHNISLDKDVSNTRKIFLFDITPYGSIYVSNRNGWRLEEI